MGLGTTGSVNKRHLHASVISCCVGTLIITYYIVFFSCILAAQQRRNDKNSRRRDDESLPSYMIVTGLPSYDEAIERMKLPAAASMPAGEPYMPPPAISVVQMKNEVAPPEPADPKFGLVSHRWYTHEAGCSHCLSVQELLETYDVS